MRSGQVRWEVELWRCAGLYKSSKSSPFAVCTGSWVWAESDTVWNPDAAGQWGWTEGKGAGRRGPVKPRCLGMPKAEKTCRRRPRGR